MKLATSLLFLLTASTSHAAELVKSCDIGTRLAITRDSRIADTHVYYLQEGKKRSPVFGTPDQSRGSAVHAACVGKKVRALVVSGEFTANALQGFVITHRPGSATPERLDFAEKSRPQWLYLSPHEVIAVIPTLGYGETNAKYVAYHHIVGEPGADRVDATNQLPPSGGFEVVNMRSSMD
ncbi:hypothetical protein [Rugamonas rivuli]|uniref:Uncharacterized protein n=1 Tax=Rugamonas rivuli TaxID=2743358 RepID=A0A843SDP7_9BURK|nr:hypothetical protein [Rugamonas rivuli]MQA20323.1 hypothetical protein [Rugamonas rivuli]